MPGEPHTIITDGKKAWVCTKCNRVWTVEDTPCCYVCQAFAIECQYCAVYKPDYECFNVQFVSEGDDGNEVVADVEEMCDVCLKAICEEHNVDLKFELLDTVADDVKNGVHGYEASDEEDIL